MWFHFLFSCPQPCLLTLLLFRETEECQKRVGKEKAKRGRRCEGESEERGRTSWEEVTRDWNKWGEMLRVRRGGRALLLAVLWALARLLSLWIGSRGVEGRRTWSQAAGLLVSREDTQVFICTSIHTSSIPWEPESCRPGTWDDRPVTFDQTQGSHKSSAISLPLSPMFWLSQDTSLILSQATEPSYRSPLSQNVPNVIKVW